MLKSSFLWYFQGPTSKKSQARKAKGMADDLAAQAGSGLLPWALALFVSLQDRESFFVSLKDRLIYIYIYIFFSHMCVYHVEGENTYIHTYVHTYIYTYVGMHVSYHSDVFVRAYAGVCERVHIHVPDETLYRKAMSPEAWDSHSFLEAFRLRLMAKDM